MRFPRGQRLARSSFADKKYWTRTACGSSQFGPEGHHSRAVANELIAIRQGCPQSRYFRFQGAPGRQSAQEFGGKSRQAFGKLLVSFREVSTGLAEMKCAQNPAADLE